MKPSLSPFPFNEFGSFLADLRKQTGEFEFRFLARSEFFSDPEEYPLGHEIFVDVEGAQHVGEFEKEFNSDI